MSSTVSLANSLAHEEALRGVRRSRFSFHFKTRRVRRWLLIQFVSVPAMVADTVGGATLVGPSAERAGHKTLAQLVDQYQAGRLLNQWR